MHCYNKFFYADDDYTLKQSIHKWLHKHPQWKVIEMKSIFMSPYNRYNLCVLVCFEEQLNI